MKRYTGKSSQREVETPANATNDNLRWGLSLLLQSHTYSKDAGTDSWEFALEIERLYQSGLTISDIRWLVAKGFAQHGVETSLYGDAHRSFRPTSGLSFQDSTCLTLTPTGAEFAKEIMEQFGVFPLLALPFDSEASGVTDREPQGKDEKDGPRVLLKPQWDSKRRELRLDGTSVKSFRVPARNQQAILAAFEEEAWPEHIDDPLPVSGEIDPHTRLHDTIYRLNHRQANRLIRFRGNGNADGVLWERV